MARWLALRLTAEGFKVWLDQFELLGGESFPRDIDAAIKTRTFRMLALLSKHSLVKPNPLKERTLALSIARDRKLDFLIPLNVDGLSPTELDWMTSDITFVPFERSWAEGLSQLLHKLVKIGAPRSARDGATIAASQVVPRGILSNKPERLFANLLPVEAVPEVIYRYRFQREPSKDAHAELARRWPHYMNNRVEGITQRFYAFSFQKAPSHPPVPLFPAGAASWQEVQKIEGLSSWQIAKPLLRKTLLLELLGRGLQHVDGDTGAVYFPDGLLPKNKITYRNAVGRKVSTQVVGTRAFRGTEKFMYRLGFTFDFLRLPNMPLVAKLRLRLAIASIDGDPLPPLSAIARRRSITRTWFNHEFGSRQLAVASFLGDGKAVLSIDIGQRFHISTSLVAVESPFGINEDELPKGKRMFLPKSDRSQRDDLQSSAASDD